MEEDHYEVRYAVRKTIQHTHDPATSVKGNSQGET